MTVKYSPSPDRGVHVLKRTPLAALPKHHFHASNISLVSYPDRKRTELRGSTDRRQHSTPIAGLSSYPDPGSRHSHYLVVGGITTIRLHSQTIVLCCTLRHKGSYLPDRQVLCDGNVVLHSAHATSTSLSPFSCGYGVPFHSHF
jgi:hypothetical protein